MAHIPPRLSTARLRAGGRRFVRRIRTRAAAIEIGSQLALWPVAAAVGVATGYAVVGFVLTIRWLESRLYGADNWQIHTYAATLEWWHLVLVPVIGGLVVGQILVRLSPTRRARGIDDVIQAAALNGGRISKRQGLASALAALVTLSSGGSTGREGPAVHIGAVIARKVTGTMKAMSRSAGSRSPSVAPIRVAAVQVLAVSTPTPRKKPIRSASGSSRLP